MRATSKTLSLKEMARKSPVGIMKASTGLDAATLLAKAGIGKTAVNLKERDVVFSQGDPANAVFYIQKGQVKLTVVTKNGKEGTIALLGAGEFIGEGCLMSAQTTRMESAAALTECTLLRIDREAMLRALRREHAFSNLFVSFLLARKIRFEADLVDQLFNSTEKRLARVLLLLSQFGQTAKPETTIPNLSQETLAGMVGTTRSRVSFFMNRFRESGFIDYRGGDPLQVHNSLLDVVLQD
jgi:CRP-like cAMP-binding protein